MNSKQQTKFKQTDIGLIPEEWEVKELKALCVEGGIQTGPFGSQLHNRDYVSEGTPIITVEHLGDNRIIHNDLPKVSDNDRIRLNKYSIKEGDIIFSRVGSVDRRAIAKKTEEGWLFSGRCLRVRTDREKIVPSFLSYYFGLEKFKERVRSYAFGATMPSLNTKLLMDMKVVVPQISEQRVIAKIFSDFDLKIDLNQQMNKILESIGQALFKHWFIDFEFPNEEGNPYKSSGGEMVYSEELQIEIPNGWIVKSIDEIANFLNGLALQKFPVHEDEEYLPVIKIRELKQGITESSDKANLSIPEEYVVDDGDILFSWSGSLEVVIWYYGKGALNQHLFKVTSDTYPKWFYYYWTLHYLPEYRCIAEGKATTMGHIQRQHLKNSLVIVPTVKVLEEMNKLMKSIIEKLIQINVESRNLSQIRDALLPKLMSGQLRVPVPQTETAI
ncbi:MAG: restriction endonuclease subunit S [Candidatus Aenigmarchaeota archaeon]|nr:restriction endonuclease subunit S [Candidatus Aenigmarchaeota archaeon]